MDLIHWIHAASYAEYIRNSSFAYPVLQILHVAGIAIAVGSALTGNARLLGAAPGLPLAGFSRHLYQWAAFGLLLVLLTGVPMAVSFIAVFALNPVMWLKLLMIGAAVALNVHLALRWWDAPAHQFPRGRDKLVAGLSLGLLMGVVAMGKLLAYIGGKD